MMTVMVVIGSILTANSLYAEDHTGDRWHVAQTQPLAVLCAVDGSPPPSVPKFLCAAVPYSSSPS